MNPALPQSDKSNLHEWVTSQWARFLPWWARYWPVVFIVVGCAWLGLSLYQQPLAERLGSYAILRDSPEQSKTGHGNIVTQRYQQGYQLGREVRGLAKIIFSLLLPYLLLLTGIGHYKYWYIVRYTLLAPGSGGRWGYGMSLFFVWAILLSSLMGGKYPMFFTDLFPVLTVGYLVGYSAVLHIRERQREARELAQGQRQAELDALKAQVNPPFLFHALQGLYQTAQEEHLPRTAQSLEQLTGIMQYVLEESRQQTTDVAREIGFIRDYLRLQQLRIPERDTICITTEVEWDEKPASIVPLLLNPLIENAFKYGISIQHPCFVTIRFSVTNGILVFTTENRILPRHNLEKGTGLGLKNVRRRLELAYPDRHKLTITEPDGVYKVYLKIKLD